MGSDGTRYEEEGEYFPDVGGNVPPNIPAKANIAFVVANGFKAARVVMTSVRAT